jgi:hypothetical protein
VNEPSSDWAEGPGLAESMWRHRRLVALVVALSTGAALGYALLVQPTRYEGVARVYLDESATKRADDPSRVVRGQAEIIGSPTVLERAAGRAGGGLTRQVLEERVTVEPASDADLITVSALEASPERAARVADSVVLAYTSLLVEQAQSSAVRTADELRAAEQRLTVRLEGLEDDLAAEPENLALQAKVEARSNELEDVAEEAEATALAATRTDQEIPSVQASVVPDEPAQPRPLRTGALGAIVGLVLGALLAWWREGRERVGPVPARATPVPPEGEAAADAGDPSGPHVVTRLTRPGGPAGDDSLEGAEPGVSRLTSSLQQVVDSLEHAPEGAYHPDAPQFVADQVAALPGVDEVVVLLDEGDGLSVSGRAGLGDAGDRDRDPDDRALLDTLVEAGPHLVADAERARLLSAGIPGSTAETVVCVPLVRDEHASAVLLAGRRGEGAPGAPGAPTGNGAPAEAGDRQADLVRVTGLAQQLVPHLRAWLLLRRMTQRLGALDGPGAAPDTSPEPEATGRP